MRMVCFPQLTKGVSRFCDSDAYDLSTDAKAALQLSKTPRSKHWMDYERERLGLVILENASDIAGAYLAVAAEHKKFAKSTIQADKYFSKLKKGKTDADAALALGRAGYATRDALAAGGTEKGNQAFEELLLFTSGKYNVTPSWKRMGHSYRDMRDLSENLAKMGQVGRARKSS